MNRWKALGFILVFAVPAQMPRAAWLSAHSALPSAMCWFLLFFLFVLALCPPLWRRVMDWRVAGNLG